jgi:hypothetical protein
VDGVEPRPGSLPCALDPTGAPETIPAEERVPDIEAKLLDPKDPTGLVKVGCPADMHCCMLPAGDRGGQYVTFVDAYHPASRGQSPPPRVAPVGALRMVPGAGSEAIEFRVLWVDRATLGMRVARRSEVSLTPVGGPVGPIQVYAFRDGGKVVAIVPARGGLWGYDDTVQGLDFEQYAGTTCAFMQFELTPVAGQGWTRPVVMVGPLKTYRPGEAIPYTGPQVRIEIQALKAAADQAPVVRATVQSWSAKHADGGTTPP